MLARSLGCGGVVLMRCGWPLRPSRSVPEKLSDLKLGRQYEKVAGTCPWSATGTTAGHGRAPAAPAASLLVSTARSSCGGGVPRRVRTTYVGVCSSCRPDAMGAYARAQPRASSESRYSSRDAHATPGLPEPRPRRRRRPGPSGEQGPNACDTCSVFPASGGVAGHDELELECDAAAPPATTSSRSTDSILAPRRSRPRPDLHGVQRPQPELHGVEQLRGARRGRCCRCPQSL